MFSSKWMLVLLLVLPLAVIVEHKGFSVHAEDIVEGEEEVNIEDEPGLSDDGALSGKDETDETEDDVQQSLKANPDVNTYFLITKPSGMGLDLPAGKDVSFLVGFANKGNKEFIVDTMEASFRYAMDFSYHLQNFSAIAYNRVVKPNEEATVAYSFFVSEAYSARPYGFTVNLYYRDADGNQYANAVFNETMTIVELDEGLDGETFFLYLLMGAVVILLLVGLQQLFSTYGKKHLPSKPRVEMGTTNQNNDVDYDWIPQETLNALNKSPKGKQTSPRQRRPKRATGSGDD